MQGLLLNSAIGSVDVMDQETALSGSQTPSVFQQQDSRLSMQLSQGQVAIWETKV